MLPTDLAIQRGPRAQTMMDEGPFLCSVSPCCAGVAQTCHSLVMLACRSVKPGDRRIVKRLGNVHVGALQLVVPGQLDAAHHAGCVCKSQAPTMLPEDRKGLLLAKALAERL